MKQVVKMRLEDPGQKILNDPERIMNEVSIMKGLEHVSKIELGLGGGGWSFDCLLLQFVSILWIRKLVFAGALL